METSGMILYVWNSAEEAFGVKQGPQSDYRTADSKTNFPILPKCFGSPTAMA